MAERIIELDFGEIDKASGKPIVHELHVDLDRAPVKGSILSLIPSYYEHKSWEGKLLDTSDKEI